MKPYLSSLAAGILVGLIYSLVRVRSPAPPVIALVGLLGMLAGEQIPTLVKQVFGRQLSVATWLSQQVRPHCFGCLPQGSNSSGAINEEGQRHE